MKIAALVSGGKDSIFALYQASKQHEISTLITIKPKRDDSYMFHFPNIELTRLQARAMKMHHLYSESSGEKEKELLDLKKSLVGAKMLYNIKGIVSGALASNYQKERIDKLCKELNLKSLAPLWHIDPEQYLHDLLDNKFKIIITGIAADGLTHEYLGEEINKEMINKFKKLKIHLGGEGGEYETLVLDCPIFKKVIEIQESEIKMENECTGKLFIKKSKLIDK